MKDVLGIHRDLDAMTIHPPTLTDLKRVAEWREDCRESLRTPYMVSEVQQEKYFAHIEDSSNVRMWRFTTMVPWPNSLEGGEPPNTPEFAAFGGLQDIQWENGLAEISLIVNPEMRGKGIGRQCVDIILHEAFDNMRLETVWGEVYQSNLKAVDFWRKTVEGWADDDHPRREAQITNLYWRKRWNGDSYSALYFAFHHA